MKTISRRLEFPPFRLKGRKYVDRDRFFVMKPVECLVVIDDRVKNEQIARSPLPETWLQTNDRVQKLRSRKGLIYTNWRKRERTVEGKIVRINMPGESTNKRPAKIRWNTELLPIRDHRCFNHFLSIHCIVWTNRSEICISIISRIIDISTLSGLWYNRERIAMAQPGN